MPTSNLTSVTVADDPRAVVLRALMDTRGNILRAAHELGITRVALYDYIKAFELWPAVNELRRRRVEDRRLRNKREPLRRGRRRRGI